MLKKMITTGVAIVGALGIQVAANAAACFTDNYSYLWNLDVVNDTADHQYFSGTMTNSSGTYEASAIYTKNSSFVSVASDFGTGFHYNLVWGLNGGTGAFINTTGAGNGEVTTFAPTSCSSVTALSAESVSGSAPGIE